MEGRAFSGDSRHRELLQAIEAANLEQAEAVIGSYARQTSHSRAYAELVEPVLVEIGERWAQGRPMILAQGYLAAKLVENLMADVLEERQGAEVPLNAYGPVLIGNIEDDFHSLGRKMVVTFLRAAGWDVRDLGNDVPAADFVAAAREAGARIIGASAMMYTTAMNIKKLRAAIDESELKGRVKLAVGGAVFNLRPELLAEVGSEGTARNAMLVPELFERLARDAGRVGP